MIQILLLRVVPAWGQLERALPVVLLLLGQLSLEAHLPESRRRGVVLVLHNRRGRLESLVWLRWDCYFSLRIVFIWSPVSFRIHGLVQKGGLLVLRADGLVYFDDGFSLSFEIHGLRGGRLQFFLLSLLLVLQVLPTFNLRQRLVRVRHFFFWGYLLLVNLSDFSAFEGIHGGWFSFHFIKFAASALDLVLRRNLPRSDLRALWFLLGLLTRSQGSLLESENSLIGYREGSAIVLIIGESWIIILNTWSVNWMRIGWYQIFFVIWRPFIEPNFALIGIHWRSSRVSRAMELSCQKHHIWFLSGACPASLPICWGVIRFKISFSIFLSIWVKRLMEEIIGMVRRRHQGCFARAFFFELFAKIQYAHLFPHSVLPINLVFEMYLG